MSKLLAAVLRVEQDGDANVKMHEDWNLGEYLWVNIETASAVALV